MVIGPDVTRLLHPGEQDEADALLRAAFAGPGEADLVRALRAEGAMAWEFVQPWSGRIGAYAAISRMVAPAGWYCLAPVAVRPDWQNGALGRLPDGRVQPQFRFGSRLVRAIADLFAMQVPVIAQDATRRGDGLANPPTLVVLGKPSFYARAGFSAQRAARLRSPYPLDHTLIARPGSDVPEAELVYPAAFSGL